MRERGLFQGQTLKVAWFCKASHINSDSFMVLSQSVLTLLQTLFFSLPTFDDFEVGTEKPNIYNTISSPPRKPSYPDKNEFTTKYEIPSTEPAVEIQGEKQPMYPNLKPPAPNSILNAVKIEKI